MSLCLRIEASGMWRRDARCVVTDDTTYRSSFISIGQIVKKAALGPLVPKDGGTLIIETAGTDYPKTRRHILTSVRYSAQKWIAQIVDNYYVKSHCCCTATSVTVSTDVRTQMSVPGRIMSDRLQKEISHLLEEIVSADQWDVCFVLLLKTVSAGGLYVKLELLCREIQMFV
jgi:hypothetical protein